MRKIAALSLLPLLLAACSGDNPASEESSSPNAIPGLNAAPSNPVFDGGASSPRDATIANARIQVEGHVVNDALAAFAGALVRVVDANGVTQDAIADQTGAFTFADVASPYDVSVRPVTGQGAFAYLGLRRSSLRLVDAAGDPPGVDQQGTVSFSVPLPDCAGNCLVDFSTTSAEAPTNPMNNVNGAWSHPSSSTATHSLSHVWSGPTTTNHVQLSVLVSDESYEHFWYAQTDGTPSLDAGGTLSLGTIALAPVAARGPVAITTDVSRVPSALATQTLQVTARTATGITLPLQSVTSGSLVAFLPDLPNGTFDVSSQRSDEQPRSWQSTSAMAFGLALATPTVPLELMAPLASIHPSPGASFSASSQLMTWQPTLQHTTAIEFANPALEAMVYVDGAELSFARLSALGITLEPGSKTLYLASGDNATVDTIVDPARVIRSTRHPVDMLHVGRYAELEFTLTP